MIGYCENDVYGDCNAIDLVTVRKFEGYCCVWFVIVITVVTAVQWGSHIQVPNLGASW